MNSIFNYIFIKKYNKLMDSIHGKGNYHWSNGDKYEGDWKENLQNGKGIKTYASGAFYDGTWLNGKMINKVM